MVFDQWRTNFRSQIQHDDVANFYQSCWWNWTTNFLPTAVHRQLFSWRVESGEIDPWRNVTIYSIELGLIAVISSVNIVTLSEYIVNYVKCVNFLPSSLYGVICNERSVNLEHYPKWPVQRGLQTRYTTP